MIQFKTIDGLLLRDMVMAGTAILEKNREAVDALNVLCWMKTKDGEKGRNRPLMISDKLKSKKPVEDTGRFADVDDFEAFRARFFEPMKEGE